MKTDAELQRDVQDELKWWPNVDASQIGVTAADGVITLTGEVPHYSQKYDAERAAKAVFGVKAVANDVEVEPNGAKRTDRDIAAAALAALEWDYEVPDDKIQLTVKNGGITLEGTVDWQYQKEAATRAVRNLMGVLSVVNLIRIAPSVKRGDLKTAITGAFRRNAALDADQIAILVDDGQVILRGDVSSWSEHDAAVSTAWGAPGVSAVVDELHIRP